MIPTSTYVLCGIMAFVGFLGPIILAVWWLRKHREEKFTTILIGTGVWFLFAMVLETIPKVFLLTPTTSVGAAISSNPWLMVVVAALLAGIFEETGRFLAYKTVLKKKQCRETAITYGIGHGGFEAMYILMVVAAQNIIFSILINTGRFQSIIDQATEQGAALDSIKTIPEQLASLSILDVSVSIGERVFAVLLHIALSIIVFYGVKKTKAWPYILSIFLHALIDVQAGLYQTGVINIYITEVLIAVYAIIIFVIAYKTFYKKLRPIDLNGIKEP